MGCAGFGSHAEPQRTAEVTEKRQESSVGDVTPTYEAGPNLRWVFSANSASSAALREAKSGGHCAF